MNEKYLLYLIKNRKIALIFFFVMYLAFTLVPWITIHNSAHDKFIASAGTGFFMSVALIFMLPVIQFSFVHKRNSADLYFSLPVKRRDQLITNILFSFLIAFGYFLVSILIVYIFMAHFAVGFGLVISLILAAALGIMELLIIHSAIYLIANNEFDGIVMLAAYACIPLLVTICANIFAYQMIAGITSSSMDFSNIALLSPVYMIFNNFVHLVEGSPLKISYYVMPVLFTIAACYIAWKNFTERKTERAEQLSDQFLAYPFIIHIYAFLILVVLAASVITDGIKDILIFYLLLTFIYIVATFVYRRKIEINLKYISIYVISIIVSFVLAFACWSTKGFGIAENYSVDKTNYLSVNYNATCRKDDLSKQINYNNEDYLNTVTVGFDMQIPLKDSQYDEVFTIIDQYRKKGINEFYQNHDAFGSNSYAMIHFNNTEESGYVYLNNYNYSLNTFLTEEELLKINQFTPVTIYDNNGKEYTLDTFLKKRKG